MAGRGHFTPLGGPRLPHGGNGTEGADPAEGAKVPRCRTCGLPESGLVVHRFVDRVLINGVTYVTSYAVCLDCILRSNPRPIADPLDVQTAV